MFHNLLFSIQRTFFPSIRKMDKNAQVKVYGIGHHASRLFRDERHVIYAEGTYDKKYNAFIQAHLQEISAIFSSRGLRFIYLPVFLQQLQKDGVIQYCAPYASASFAQQGSSWLFGNTSYPLPKDQIGPQLLFNGGCGRWEPTNSLWKAVAGISLHSSDTLSDKQLLIQLELVAHRIQRYPKQDQSSIKREVSEFPETDIHNKELDNWHVLEIPESDSGIKYSMRGSGFTAKEEAKPEETHPVEADATFQSESRKIISEILDRVKLLKQHGISEDVLISLLQSQGEEPLSRLRIDGNYRIWLPQYHDMEVKMTPLVKAVYLLFLSHPEGIVFKELPDYRKELENIYCNVLHAEHLDASQLESICKLTDPFNNSINEKCARIREAFLRLFDEHLAQNYIVNGNRGEAKRIPLDRSLVFWD